MPKSSKTALNSIETHYLTQYPGEFAEFILTISHEECYQLLKKHSVSAIVGLFENLPNSYVAHLLTLFPLKTQVELMSRIDTQYATEIIKNLQKQEAQTLINSVSNNLSSILQEALTYTENSAGAMMDRHVLHFHANMSVREAIHRLKKFSDRHYRVIFITDEQDQLTHYVPVQDLLFAKRETTLNTLQKSVIVFARDIDTKATAQDLLEQYKITDLPVVDVNGKLLGIIRYRVIFNSIREAAFSEMQSMVGASPDESALSKISVVVRKRLPWLQINLLTAFLAAFVVGIFESTIAKYTALAILLPIVAGQSGNTGAQALAVTMRGLVLKEVYSYQWKRILIKEALAAFINGLAVAITTSICIYLWSQSFGLSLIIFLSMIISMILAAMAGALTPIALNKFGLDPAQSSSIILTTITDVCGFFCFLGIATSLITLLPV